MILALSFILGFGSLIALFIGKLLSGELWWIALLWGIGGFVVAFSILCIVIILILIFGGKALAKHYNPKSPFRHWLIREIARFCNFWLGVRYHVEGLERIPKDRPFVIYTNHQGFLDMFIFFVVLKDYPHASLYKDSHDRNPLIGGIAKALGGMGLDRENDFKAAETIIKVIKEVKSGVNFMIYPEGTRSRGPNLLPFRAGSFKVAQKAQANLIVLALDGSYKVARRMPLITRVYVKVVDCLSPEFINSMKTHELSDLLHQKIEEDIAEARKKYRFLKVPKRYLKQKQEIDETGR